MLVNGATKLSESFLKLDKHYDAKFMPGFTTDTWDMEGYKTNEGDSSKLTIDDIKKAALKLKGSFLQTPPAFSAKKINGKPAYYYARRNPYDSRIQELNKKEVKIFNIRVLSFNGREAQISLHCSSGTYVRSVIYEIGQMLGCGATMSALTRTAIGGFKLRDCIDADEIDGFASSGIIKEYENSVISIENARELLNTRQIDIK